MSKRFGFTLAEVLITLGIIGVVAGITIPVLMNNIQDQQFKEAYKKAYSVASQAWLNAYTNGTITPCSTAGDWVGGTCYNDNFKAFKNEMKVSKDCGTNTSDCWDMSGEVAWYGWTNSPVQGSYAFIDNAGFAWSKAVAAPDEALLIDTNGKKGPNQYGRDRAIFYLHYLAFAVTDGSSITNDNNWKVNIPQVLMLRDMPNAQTVGVYYFCRSYAIHPCYYTSWITGGH